MKRKQPAGGPGAIELMEEAVHLLRRAPASLLALYAVGTVPFVLAFLFFWAEMSRGAFAREHAGSDALGLALVFLWMKFWQAAFASELRARVSGQTPERWTLKRIGRLAFAQTALQPIGLFAVPAAAVIMLPFGWAYGFFQNVTVLAGGTIGMTEAAKASATQASARPGQAWLALMILSAFAFFVWLNLAVFMAMLPGLLKSLLGLDTEYTRAGAMSILNTTCLACTVALSYLVVDPLAKAVYVLRCFYGRSLQSGEDLKAELLRVRAQAVTALVVLFCLAGSSASASPETAVTASQLNQSIDQVQKEPQFAWRMPREAPKESNAQQSWLVRVLRSWAEAVAGGLKWVGHGLSQMVRWIWEAFEKLWPHSKFGTSSGRGFDWLALVQIVLVVLIIAIAACLVVLIIRGLARQRRAPLVAADVVAARPDLTDENVAADQLPEEGWLALARELMAQGNLRLALRALYLAGLAHLAARELISVAVFKSNREYETELRRRARANPETLSAFSQNVAVFDCVWYGLYEVTSDTLQVFEANLQRIRAC
jgi:hypothetical protein